MSVSPYLSLEFRACQKRRTRREANGQDSVVWISVRKARGPAVQVPSGKPSCGLLAMLTVLPGTVGCPTTEKRWLSWRGFLPIGEKSHWSSRRCWGRWMNWLISQTTCDTNVNQEIPQPIPLRTLGPACFDSQEPIGHLSFQIHIPGLYTECLKPDKVGILANVTN